MVSKQKEDTEKDGEKTLKIPCNNMVELLTTQQDKQEQEFSKYLYTGEAGSSSLSQVW
jgi:hypothetical protein